MQNQSEQSLTDQIVDFLMRIGIKVAAARIEEETFLPGILIARGEILVDRRKLIYPGDLLHEAGHIAVVPGRLRHFLNGEVSVPELDADLIEQRAIAWSYAAAVHLGIEPRAVFHAGGYRGQSEQLLTTFGYGVYPGANGLEDFGLTATGARAAALGVAPFPQMLKWMCD